MADRRRYRQRRTYVPAPRDFINNYPWMPSTDARIYQELLNRRIPFSYRYFNTSNAYINQLLPGWAPEFTLKDYKIVILVKGTFFGQIPGVLQRDVLAQVILKQAGWKVLTWYEFDIKNRLYWLFNSVPEFRKPKIHGGMYRNPYGIQDIMETFRRLRARQKVYLTTDVDVYASRPRSRRRLGRGGSFSLRRQYNDSSRRANYRSRIRPPR